MTHAEQMVMNIEYLNTVIALNQAERRSLEDRRSRTKKAQFEYIAAQVHELENLFALLDFEPVDLLDVDFSELERTGAEAYLNELEGGTQK